VAPDNVVQLTNVNLDLARESFSWLYHDLKGWQPGFVAVQDGIAVSACYSSRIGSEAAEAGVDTLAEYRGHGYASDVTAAWAAAVRASGRIPLYSTSWGNVASQGVARRLGLILYGADLSLS
jgi:predicted GNAT family acetyltransferase